MQRDLFDKKIVELSHIETNEPVEVATNKSAFASRREYSRTDSTLKNSARLSFSNPDKRRVASDFKSSVFPANAVRFSPMILLCMASCNLSSFSNGKSASAKSILEVWATIVRKVANDHFDLIAEFLLDD